MISEPCSAVWTRYRTRTCTSCDCRRTFPRPGTQDHGHRPGAHARPPIPRAQHALLVPAAPLVTTWDGQPRPGGTPSAAPDRNRQGRANRARRADGTGLGRSPGAAAGFELAGEAFAPAAVNLVRGQAVAGAAGAPSPPDA